VFDGEPGVKGHADSPDEVSDGFDDFLEQVDMTFRKDPDTGRPRANKPKSQKDRKQREKGEFYE